jgi:uncharacterized repeat protein (TIGR01451 family)
LLAEKCLERSAKLYRAAGYLGKEEDTLKALVSLQEKKEFFLSLGNLLTAPQDTIDARGTPLREALHHTPVVSTLGFPAPAPTCEKAVGLGKFEHADIQGNLVTPQKKLKAGEDILLSIELINAGKSPASLIRIADVIPEGFDVVQESGMYCVEDNDIKMKGKQLNPLQVEEVRVILRTFEKGTFLIAPNILCLVEGGNQISCKPEPVEISVSEFILPSRVSTGWGDLDSLLFGGIPESFAVVMTSPSCDERDLLTRKFVEAGTKKGETAFYVTTLTEVKSLAEENQPNFHLFICNPQADKSMESLPNVFRINGVENLTEINIALAKAFRAAGLLQKGRKRACIGLVSDVLLQHHAVQTRRWLISLITDFKSKGFTTLMTMNPQMHSLQEVQAILDLFDGEISICERETEKGLQKFLKVKKMSNQQYLGCELPLRRERLER